MAHAVFVLCSLRCLTDSPTQPSMVSQNPRWAQRSDCAFNQRQTKRVKYHIGNVTRQSFPPCSCVDVVKKFNGTEDLSTDWNLRWELPSSSVPRDLQRELTYTFCASEFLTSALQGKEIDLTLPTLWINGGTTIITRTTKLQRRQLGEETKVQPITTYSLLSHHQAYNSTSTFIYPFYRWGN